MVARWHDHLHGLATANHETSGLTKNGQSLAGLLHKDKAPLIARSSRGMSFDQFQHLVVILLSGCCTHLPTDLIENLFNIENLVLKTRSAFKGFTGAGANRFGVLEYWSTGNSKLQITNIKQITMTKIRNSKPVLCFGH
jgi:hypothetical protein